MVKWYRTIDLNPEHNKCKNGELSVRDLAKSVAEKLRKLTPMDDPTLEMKRKELAQRFQAASKSKNLDEDKYNAILSDLYDWGDMWLNMRQRACCIKSI